MNRLELVDYASITGVTNHICLLGVEKSLKYLKTKLFSIFDINIWLLLIFSLILLSIFNTKFKKNHNIVLSIINSFINHLEQLISKSGKMILLILVIIINDFV